MAMGSGAPTAPGRPARRSCSRVSAGSSRNAGHGGGPARVLRVRRAMAYHRGMDASGRQGRQRAAHERYSKGTEYALAAPTSARYRRRWPWSPVAPKG
jgi:hypothetical protein